ARSTLAGTSAAAGPVPAGAESPLQAAFEPGIQESPAPKIERQAVLVGYGVKLGTTKRRQRKGDRARTSADGGSAAEVTPSATPPAAAVPAETAGPSAPVPGASVGAPAEGNGRVQERPAAKPPVRKLAKDLGVD